MMKPEVTTAATKTVIFDGSVPNLSLTEYSDKDLHLITTDLNYDDSYYFKFVGERVWYVHPARILDIRTITIERVIYRVYFHLEGPLKGRYVTKTIRQNLTTDEYNAMVADGKVQMEQIIKADELEILLNRRDEGWMKLQNGTQGT